MSYSFPPIENIERPEELRIAHQPIQHEMMFDFYKVLEASFWSDEDIDKDAQQDRFDYDNASPGEKRLYEYVQGFFVLY